MKMLSLYSKIQLKIEKCRERKISFQGDEERRFSFLNRDKNFCSLLFWKTAKVVVRFYALLFNDSSDNFLMFANEMGYKTAKRFHSPKGTMEPTITFVCNNSYCQYKKFQKRVRFYSKTAFAGILVCTVITSGILYFMMPGKDFVRAATNSWFQTDWLLGADTGAVATHTSDQTGWQKFYSKDNNIDITTAGEIKLASTASTIVETDDVDFNAGTQSTGLAAGGDFYINGGNLYLKKAAEGSCAVADECINGLFCINGSCTHWLVGPCTGIGVYDVSLAEQMQWKTSNTSCISPQCSGGSLVADNDVDFSEYPARNACKALGGRLPTQTELHCLYVNRASYGTFVSAMHWSNTEYSATDARGHQFNSSGSSTVYDDKNKTYHTRCVRTQ